MTRSVVSLCSRSVRMMQRVLPAMLCAVGMAHVAAAQDTTRLLQLADRGPRFLYAPAHGEAPTDARRATVFKRTIALSVADVPVADALVAIGRAAGVRIVYKTDVLPAGTTVSIDAGRITVAAALTDVLQDVAVDVELTGSGIVTLVPRPAAVAPSRRTELAADGSIAGSTTDSLTGASVPYVTLTVVETGRSVVSKADGQYVITHVTAGEYRVTAKRVGYIVRTRTVVVEEGKVATLNFKLNEPLTKLDEVVTTAVGDQRRYTLGNVISTVNVDSIAPTAPITSVTDILTSRVPGLDVVETGGLTGSGEAIRIRGQSSIALQSDPIIIVDGVRQDNSAGGSYNPSVGGVIATPSRINDIDVSQIATIDVLKGPAASTEYGTDAANGVIVITTKRGTSGKPQWHASVEEGLSDIPGSFPNYYTSYGHLTDGSNTPVQCPLVYFPGTPQSTNGSCAVDSVTHNNPLNHSATSIYGTGTRGKYGLDVSGGTDAIRYWLGGGLSNETGALQLPPVFVPEAEALGFPAAALNPNGEQQRSGRGNTFFRVGSTADISLNVAYLSTYQTVPLVSGQGLFLAASNGGPADSANNYGWGPNFQAPLATITALTTQQTNRFTGGLSGNWRPSSWFSAFADAGIDHGTQQSTVTDLPQLFVYEGEGNNNGQYALGQTSTDIYSADLRATATATLSRLVRVVTTFGGNLRDTRTAGLYDVASGLTASNLTLVGASALSVTQTGSRNATLGGYGEEQFQIADRLFATGALRVDGASGFGKDYQAAVYPKLSASWLAVKDRVTTVRLRAAFGASGVAPYNGLSLQLYTPVVVAGTQGPTSASQLTQPGNPNLKPERSQEWEGGVDLGLWGNRVSLEFSGYSKTTQDALFSETLGWDLNNAPYEINIGEIRNRGLEAQFTAIPVESRSATWVVTVNASVNHNLLVHLAPGLSPLLLGAQRNQPGYPLYGYWGNQVHYSDANHDGIIEPNEVTESPHTTYMGSSIPTQQGAFDTHLTLLHGTLSIGALFTYQGGYRVYNRFAAQAASDFGTLEAQNIPGSSLWQQARAVAITNDNSSYPSSIFEDGTVLRFQELSLTYALPAVWAHAVRVHSLGLTGAIRNLAYWTRYSGGDPSASEAPGQAFQASANSYTVNNDLRTSGGGTVPLARYFQFRLNVGF